MSVIVNLGGFAKHNIRKTFSCNIYPIKPNFYIEKMGYAGVYLFVIHAQKWSTNLPGYRIIIPIVDVLKI